MFLLRLVGLRTRLVLAMLGGVAMGAAAMARHVPTEALPASYPALALAACVAFLVSLVVVRSVTAPVRALDEALRHRIEGDADATVRDRGHDEVGVLARTVNDFLTKVDDGLLTLERERAATETARSRLVVEASSRGADVELLLSVAEVVRHGGDFGAAASGVLTSLNDHLRLGWSSVFLLDAPSESLHLVASQGLDAGLSELLRLEGSRPVHYRPGEGLSGLAIATGQSQVATEGHRDRRFKLFERAGTHYRRIENMAAVPISSDDGVVGLLMGFNAPAPDRFSTGALELMERVAGLLGRVLGRGADFEESFCEGLTGLLLKDYWDQKLQVEVERAGRSRKALGLACVEIRFPGASAEDPKRRSEVLEAAGRVVRENLRLADAASRDGYVIHVLLPDTDSLGSMFVAGRIKDRLDAWVFEQGGEPPVAETLAGVASFPDDVDEPSALVAAATRALDDARRVGDGRLVCYGRPGDGGAA